MSEYVLITDSSADLSQEMVQELGVTVLPLSFTIQGKTYRNYPDNREMDLPLFYDMLRAGELATPPRSTWPSTLRRWSRSSRRERTF